MAAIPSSPPPIPLHDPPSSPPLPAFDEISSNTARKRPLTDYDSLSSDPIFSEDVSESDSYTGAKRKKLWKGPWWRHELVHEQGLDRPAATKVSDSGVWLSSEASDDASSQEDILPCQSSAMSRPKPNDHYSSHRGFGYATGKQRLRHHVASMDSAETLAGRIIVNCLETGDESIDLS